MSIITFSIPEEAIPFLDQKIFGHTLFEHQIQWAYKVKKTQTIILLAAPESLPVLNKFIEGSTLKSLIKIQPIPHEGAPEGIPITTLHLTENNTITIKSKDDITNFKFKFRRYLLETCEGLIAFGLNKRISIPLSVYLAKWKIAPNTISFIALFLSLMGGYLLITHQNLACAFMLFQINSILDGCDGEVAKMNYAYSDLGKKIDVFSDNLTTGIIFLAGGYSLSHRGLFTWIISLIFLALTPLLCLLYKLISKNKISLENIEGVFHQKMKNAKTRLQKIHKLWLYITNRDFNIFLMTILAFLNAGQYILWYMLFLSLSWFVFSIETLVLISDSCSRSNANHSTDF